MYPEKDSETNMFFRIYYLEVIFYILYHRPRIRYVSDRKKNENDSDFSRSKKLLKKLKVFFFWSTPPHWNDPRSPTCSALLFFQTLRNIPLLLVAFAYSFLSFFLVSLKERKQNRKLLATFLCHNFQHYFGAIYSLHS